LATTAARVKGLRNADSIVAGTTPKATKIVPVDLKGGHLTVPGGTPLLLRIPIDAVPSVILDQPLFSATLDDPGPKSPIDVRAEKSENFFEVRTPPLQPGSELDLRLRFEGNLNDRYVEATAAKASQDDAVFKEAVSWALGCGDAECREIGTSGTFYVLNHEYRLIGLFKTALTALLAASPRELSVSASGKDYRFGNPPEVGSLTLTPDQQKFVGSVVDVWMNRAGYGNGAVSQASKLIAGQDRNQGFLTMFDALSSSKGRMVYLISVSAATAEEK
jgi:hypothetical protein